MKLVIAVIQNKDEARLLNPLTENGYRATKLASTGGFLREGNTTVLIGVEDHQVESLVELIRASCHNREQLVTPMSTICGHADAYVSQLLTVTVGGATVFVLDVAQFFKF